MRSTELERCGNRACQADRWAARRSAALVGLLLALATVFSAAAAAPALSPAGAETRVRASSIIAAVDVGLSGDETAGQRLGIDPVRVVITVATGVATNSGVTRVFRVEGPGNARLSLDVVGNVRIKGDQTLFLNFGDEARAQQFLSKRLAQGYEGTAIKSFDVPNSYVEGLRSRAVPESMARGSSVFQVDTSATSGSFGVRSSEFEGLMCAIIPGSAC